VRHVYLYMETTQPHKKSQQSCSSCHAQTPEHKMSCVATKTHLSIPAVETQYKNKAKCLSCQDIIESQHRHDYISCFCGAISIDGGNEYWKQSGIEEDFQRIYEPLK
jgi:hypothetical protein